MNHTEKFGLKIDNKLLNFIENEALPGTSVSSEQFWRGFSELVKELNPKNKELLNKRENIQKKINEWHIQNRGKNHNKEEYYNFLKEINYLVDEGPEFKIETNNVDSEIAEICGPQLVVPIMNARYALNAANARWGSFYDALYGTDAMGDMPPAGNYSTDRGEKVISYAKNYLDKVVPLKGIKWKDVNKLEIINNKLIINENSEVQLVNINQYAGFRYINDKLKELIFIKNKLHLRLLIDADDTIGKDDPANIADIILESAITTIMDCEDSVAAVDSEDKVLAYRNWLGLMKGDLTEEFKKSDKIITRKLSEDISITNSEGKNVILKGRSLMLNRNVGHLMTNPSVLDENNEEVGEGLIDAICTTLIAIHDLSKKEGLRNSTKGSIYIVKPKMHGPEEVAFTNEIFTLVEEILNLPKYTVKIGIMDEERRTSVNLKECIRAAKNRVAFINTGFLDRTGDEIHTSMEAGPFLKKGDMKNTNWINAYEKRNVHIGLSCGLQGKAQIGKGMWAMPDLMQNMMEQKSNHPKAGANCAWVPSPTAATLHATHYHETDVFAVQNQIMNSDHESYIDDLLNIPVSDGQNWSNEEINKEIENNAQGILGYVVRWIDQGVGCSKVPDINNIGLMEDRATCRISSQAIANWLHHGIVTEEQVKSTMKKMAKVVDNQNSNDKKYIPMAQSFDTIAYKAACDLIFKGTELPSGYTEPVLHERRQELKKS
ncbi:MAG: malate synthase G [Pelagibacterales bacterium]|nr:malate synthase G [Pelagibacterales bacterium]